MMQKPVAANQPFMRVLAGDAKSGSGSGAAKDASTPAPPPKVDRELIRRLTLTKSFTYGTPVGATPTPDGKAVLFLRAQPRNRTQSLYELDLATVHVVGYDLGGWLAAEFASFYPERVTSLTLIASTGLRLSDAPSFEFLAADPNRVTEALFNGNPAEHVLDLPDPGDITGFVDAYGVNGVTARLIWERRYDTRLDRRVGRLRLPSLVITPEEDRMVPIAHAERWAELLSAKLVRIPDSGHACIVEQPHTVARAITALVTEVES